MSKVYVACGHWDYEGFRILGIFSTKESADEIIALHEKREWGVMNDYSVDEFELDKSVE